MMNPNQLKERADALAECGYVQLVSLQIQGAIASFEEALLLFRGEKLRTVFPVESVWKEAKIFNYLGEAYRANRDFERSHTLCQQSLTLLRSEVLGNSLQFESKHLEAEVLTNLGLLHHDRHEYQLEIDCYQQGLLICKFLSSSTSEVEIARAQEAHILFYLGLAYANLRQYLQAIEVLEQALSYSREVDERHTMIGTLNCLGFIYTNLNQPEKGIELQQQALLMVQQMTDPEVASFSEQQDMVRVLINLGQSYQASGETEQAIAFLQHARSICQEISDRMNEVISLFHLSNIYYNQKQFDEAIDCTQQILTIYHEPGFRVAFPDNYLFMELEMLCDLGEIYFESSQPQLAIATYQQALSALAEVQPTPEREKQHKNYQVMLLIRFGSVYGKQKEYKQALKCFQESLRISEETEALLQQAAALDSLGYTYWHLYQFPQMIEFYQRSLRIYQQINYRFKIIEVMSNLGFAHLNSKQFHAAIQQFEQALSILEDIISEQSDSSLQHQKVILLTDLGLSYSGDGQLHKAIDFFQQALLILQTSLSKDQQQRDKQRSAQRREQARALSGLGVAHLRLKDFTQALELHQQALAIFQEPELAEVSPQLNQADQAHELSRLAHVHRQLGQTSEAIALHQQSLSLFANALNVRGQIFALEGLQNAYSDLHQAEPAIQTGQQILSLAQVTGDRPLKAKALFDLAGTYLRFQKYELALEIYQKVLPIFRDLGDRSQLAATLNNRGVACLNLQNFAEAIRSYQQALAFYRKLSDRTNEIQILQNLSHAYHADQQFKLAQDCLQQAKNTVLQQLEDTKKPLAERRELLICLLTIARNYIQFNQLQPILECYEQVLSILREDAMQAAFPKDEAAVLCELAKDYLQFQQIQPAVNHYQQAIELCRQMGDRLNEATALTDLGNLYMRLNQPEPAIRFYEQARAADRAMNYPFGEGWVVLNLAGAYNKLGQPQQALSLFQQARDLFESEAVQREHPEEYIRGADFAYVGLSQTYCNLKQFEKALGADQKLLSLRKDAPGRVAALLSMGNNQLKLKQYEEAIATYQQASKIIQLGEPEEFASQLADLKQRVLYGKGSAHAALNQSEEAIACLEDVLKLFEEQQQAGRLSAEQWQYKAHVLLELGGVYANLKQYSQAAECYQQSAVIYRQIQDRDREESVLKASIDALQKTAVLYREKGDRSKEASALKQLGAAHLELEQVQEALTYFKNALPIFQDLQDLAGLSETWVGIGDVHLRQKQFSEATKAFTNALKLYPEDDSQEANQPESQSLIPILFEATQNKGGQGGVAPHPSIYSASYQIGLKAQTLISLGDAYFGLKQFEQTCECYERAKLLYQQTGDRWQEVRVLGYLAELNHELNQHLRSLEYYLQILRIFEGINRSDATQDLRASKADVFTRIAKTYFYRTQYQNAIQYHERAIKTYRELGNSYHEAEEWKNLGITHENLKLIDKAIAAYQNSLKIYHSLNPESRLQQSNLPLWYYDHENQSFILKRLGKLLIGRKQEIVALEYYLELVDVRKTMQKALNNAPVEVQEKLTRTIVFEYENCAKLLTKYGKKESAKQVRNLLKANFEHLAKFETWKRQRKFGAFLMVIGFVSGYFTVYRPLQNSAQSATSTWFSTATFVPFLAIFGATILLFPKFVITNFGDYQTGRPITMVGRIYLLALSAFSVGFSFWFEAQLG